MKNKIKIINLIKINFILICLLFIEFFYLYNNENSYNLFFRKFLDFQFLSILGFSLLCGTILISFFQPYNIFLGTFFIFLGGRFLLDLFNLRDVMSMDRFINFSLKGIEQIELFKVIIFAILFINLGFLVGNFLCSRTMKIKEYKISNIDFVLRKIYIVFFEIFFFLSSYKKIILYNFIEKKGYLALYREKITYPFFTKGSGTFSEISYILFLLTKPSKKIFLIISFQYLFIGFLEALSGSRGRFIIRILVVITYYFTEYEKKINYLLISGITMFVITFSQYINQFRSGLSFNLNKLFFSFFNQQGVSINVLGTIIKFKNELKDVIQFSILSFTTEEGNTILNGQSGVLSHSLSYFLSPQRYLNGEGIGGSFLGEVIALDSKIIFIILMFMLGFIIGILFLNRKKSELNMGGYLIILPHIYYMSRDSYFPNIKYLSFYFLFIIIHYLIHKKLENKFEKRSFN
ncbi:O-antigen polysaccharide polymerase Wzy [Fusobacterium perfoetens]|uniref:O-antigen polysaccharide polymerase Wzy n=1 Tax=Fusobacterium perfoetens TaxID=852 RepID=UPI001F3BB359|nr:O-antigen polysaccharide polymerase Wzy [Fusobacterium perfoetens]MCF2613237.1 O-antigen polysaccharide polymerase Wzy [Fusobacterium perfoetens]